MQFRDMLSWDTAFAEPDPGQAVSLRKYSAVDMLQVPNAACLVDAEALQAPFWYFSFAFLSFMLVLHVAVVFCHQVAKSCGRATLSDSLEFLLSILYTVLLTTLWQRAIAVLMGFLFDAAPRDGILPLRDATVYLALCILLLQLLIFLHFVRSVQGYCRGMGGGFGQQGLGRKRVIMVGQDCLV